jgi:general secretion pathway protein G
MAKERTPLGDSRPGEAGFTLLELLVVLAILVMVALIAVPQTIKYLDRAKASTARVAIENIGAALDLYRLDVGRYPSEAEGLIALVEPETDVARWNGPYLKKKSMLMDPWDRAYRYQSPGQHGAFDLYSYGADDVEGGEGVNQDIVSW